MRHKPEPQHRDDVFTANNNVYFANQVVHDAYAMHAMLSVLLNCDDTVDIGSDLAHFKAFTNEFSPMIKGLSLSNSKILKDIHNRVARHRPKRRAPSEDIYHYISYIPIDGHLWELDGFKRGPLRLAACTGNSWLDAVRTEIQRKVDIFHRQKIPYSMWSVIEDRHQVYQRRLVAKTYIKRVIEEQLDKHYPSWRVVMRVQQWEDEYRHAMENERNKRGRAVWTMNTLCRTIEDLPNEEQDAVQAELESEVLGRCMKELTDTWLRIQDDSLRLYENLGEEDMRHQQYQHEIIRRQHNYTPFIKTFIDCLTSQGHLQHMITDS
ncbi:ubiquitin carboxyl-terminal hydrolase [Apophysomyces sp. BC1034]|nr:ubiquitin carboxyl-terminal hydrolase [Apophysomyces sp. BC1021]KAG0170883.1 ubiquitin carboxyl-terminal hydrolase [Apophysomyces sp. BC1015]KAG0183678.1 ubiquitin carboxyl-terminal hydrolase [Apophysomyces sp. BC1034]